MKAKSRAEAVLFGATFIWGSTFAIVKIVLAEVPTLQMIVIRFGLATLLVVLLSRRRIFPMSAQVLVKGLVLGLFLFAGFVTQTVGLTYTSASKSAFITGMMVVIVPLLQFVIERRPPKLGNALGVATVACGLWLLTSPEGSAFNIGDALTIACAMFFAVYIVYLDVIANDMTPEQLTFLQFSSNAALAAVGAALFEPVVSRVSATTAAALLYLTLFATLLTTYVQTRFQKDTTPTRAAVIFSIEPVIAAVVAYLVLGEAMQLSAVLGGALIISGILLSEFSDMLPWLNRSVGPAEP